MDADGRTDGRAVRKAVFSMIATKRMSTLVGLSPTTQSLGHNIQQYKEESEKERLDERLNVVYYAHSDETTEELEGRDNLAKEDSDANLSHGMGKLVI